MTDNIKNFYRSLERRLPLYTEECGSSTQLGLDELITSIEEECVLNKQQVGFAVGCMVELMDSLCLLDRSELKNNILRFLSFPAWLVARSLFCSFGDPRQQFFPDGFWTTDGAADSRIEAQRHILRALELYRQENHKDKAAIPIRHIYVAWALIKVDGKILLHKREDTQERKEYKAGNYVLVGGRTNLEDLSHDQHEKDPLSLLNATDCKAMEEAAEYTLRREMMEETGLDYRQEHFTYNPWRRLAPYEQVQGARSNHALTRYYIEIFATKLSGDGYFLLMEKIQKSDRLVWFTPEEIRAGRRTTGETAYLTALYDDFQVTSEDLFTELENIPDAFPDRKDHDEANESQILEFLIPDNSLRFYCGIRGKEQLKTLDVNRSAGELLLALAAYRCGMKIILEDKSAARLLPRGWVRLATNSLFSLGKEILQSCLVENAGFRIEHQSNQYFRLSTPPERIYFDPILFTCYFSQDSKKGKVEAVIERQNIRTQLGNIAGVKASCEITSNLANSIWDKQQGDTKSFAGVRDTYRKSPLRYLARNLGLKDVVVGDDVILCQLVKSNIK